MQPLRAIAARPAAAKRVGRFMAYVSLTTA
jgi:hypothetical protein